MTGTAIRVYILARERQLPPSTVLEVARRLGCDVRNQLSTLNPQERAAVEKSLDQSPPDEPTGVPARLRPRGPGPAAAHAEPPPPAE